MSAGLVLAVIAAAIIVRSTTWLNSDTSALVTFAEKWLDGVDPYSVFHEVNPPASILLYVPVVLIGRTVGIAPEAVLTASLFVAVASSLWLAAQIVSHASVVNALQASFLLPVACALFLLLPEDVFGQRDHIAVIAILPLLTVFAARASKGHVQKWARLVAGLGAGLAIAIKPFFALALVLPLAYVAWKDHRFPKKLISLICSLENFAIVLVILAYAMVIEVWFHEYLVAMLPIARHVYLPVRFPWPILIFKPMVILPVLCLAAIFVVGADRAFRPLPLVLALSAIGFWIGAILQGKGWPYHAYPAIALTLMASFIVVIDKWTTTSTISTWRGFNHAGAIGFLCGLYTISAVYFWPAEWYQQFVSTVEHAAPVHPRLMAICGARIEYLWPVSRIVHGEAIGHGLWINDVTNALEQWGEVNAGERAVADRYAAEERRWFIGSMRDGHPNILIVCGYGWKGWALAQPEFVSEMHKFHKIADVYHAEIWVPN